MAGGPIKRARKASARDASGEVVAFPFLPHVTECRQSHCFRASDTGGAALVARLSCRRRSVTSLSSGGKRFKHTRTQRD